MNPPTSPILWRVRLVYPPHTSWSCRARTAWAAWVAACAHLGNPAFGDVVCEPWAEVTEVTLSVDTLPPIVRAIVGSLARGPRSLSAIRGALRKGKRSLRTEDVVLAVSSGAIAFDRRTGKYRLSPATSDGRASAAGDRTNPARAVGRLP